MALTTCARSVTHPRVAVYTLIIAVMVIAALGTSDAVLDPRIPMAAVLFAASDVLVARQRFVKS